MLIHIGISIVAVAAVAAAVVYGLRWRKERNETAAATDELTEQFARLKAAHNAVDNAALPRWAARMKEKLLRDTRDGLLHVERAIGRARARGKPVESEGVANITAIENAIGTGENALFQVLDATIKIIRERGGKLARFRDKLEKNLKAAFVAGRHDEDLQRIIGLARRMQWNVTEDRALKHPFAAFSLMIAHASLLNVTVAHLGERHKWQNGLLRYRIESGILRLTIIRGSREVLAKIHAFRTMRNDRPEAAWDAIIAAKGGSVSEKDLFRAQVCLEDGMKFLKHGSQVQQKIVDLVVEAETLLVGFEAAVLEVFDPHNEAERDYQRAVAEDHRSFDIQRTGVPIGSRAAS